MVRVNSVYRRPQFAQVTERPTTSSPRSSTGDSIVHTHTNCCFARSYTHNLRTVDSGWVPSTNHEPGASTSIGVGRLPVMRIDVAEKSWVIVAVASLFLTLGLHLAYTWLTVACIRAVPGEPARNGCFAHRQSTSSIHIVNPHCLFPALRRRAPRQSRRVHACGQTSRLDADDCVRAP